MPDAQDALPRALQLVAYINLSGATITVHQASCGHAQYGRGSHHADDHGWALSVPDNLTTEQLRTYINENRGPELPAIRGVRRCKHCAGRTYRTPRDTPISS